MTSLLGRGRTLGTVLIAAITLVIVGDNSLAAQQPPAPSAPANPLVDLLVAAASPNGRLAIFLLDVALRSERAGIIRPADAEPDDLCVALVGLLETA